MARTDENIRAGQTARPALVVGWLPATGELAVLAALGAALTTGAWLARPLWDDGGLLHGIQVGPPGTVYTEHLDRPLQAAIWQWWLDLGHLWEFGACAHFVSWLGLGIVTTWLWRLLYPSLPRLALVAGCLAMAPMIVRTQLVLVNPVVGGNMPVLMAYCAAFALARRERPRRSVVIAAGAMILVAGLITEYAVPAAGAMATVIGLALRRGPLLSLRRWTSPLAMVGSVTLGYAIFWAALAVPSARPSVRPELFLAVEAFWRAKIMLPRLVSDIWEVGFGSLLYRIGEWDVLNASRLVGVVAGAALAVGVAFASRSRSEGAPRDGAPSFRRSTGALLAALVVALTPVVLMGQRFDIRAWDRTRVALPALPVAACLSLALVVAIMRDRLRSVATSVVVFLCGFWTVSMTLEWVAERNRVERWGMELRDQLPSERPLVAIFNTDWSKTPGGEPHDFELTPRLVAAWDPEQQRGFWAFASLYQMEHLAESLSGDRTPSLLALEKRRFQEGFVGTATPRFVWVDTHGETLTVREHALPAFAETHSEPSGTEPAFAQ